MTKSTQEAQTIKPTKPTVLTTLDALTSEHRLVDMKYITTLTCMTAKWVYATIKTGGFPKPLKLGRSSRWKAVEVHAWLDDRRKAVDGCPWFSARS